MVWDDIRLYETGVDHGVLYPLTNDGEYTPGVPWSGLTGVTNTPEGAEPTDKYADNIKYITLRSAETLKQTIKAFTYPDEFKACNGEAELAKGVTIGQQARRTFGMSYRTIIGDDKQGTDYGYKLHLIYGCTVSPSEKSYDTVNDSPDIIEFSWEATTTPVTMNVGDGEFKPTASIEIDSTKVDKAKLKELEEILYGVDATEDDPAVPARLPLPDEIYTLFN